MLAEVDTGIQGIYRIEKKGHLRAYNMADIATCALWWSLERKAILEG